MKKKLLYIEDEPNLARVVSDTLKLKGYEVLHRKDGAKIAEHVNNFTPDLCVLDVMLPDIDGFALATHIRNINPTLPIIFLTAKNRTEDIVKGFASGGTDYIRKPFSMEELLVRIESQLKMTSKETTALQTLPDSVQLRDFCFYPGKYELHTPKGILKLSHRESQILSMLCAHANIPVDRKELLNAVWGDDSFFNSRNLDVYIRKIRGYFEGAQGIEIITLKGKGYHFVVA